MVKRSGPEVIVANGAPQLPYVASRVKLSKDVNCTGAADATEAAIAKPAPSPSIAEMHFIAQSLRGCRARDSLRRAQTRDLNGKPDPCSQLSPQRRNPSTGIFNAHVIVSISRWG